MKRLRILIIGAGRLGSALARRLSEAGHVVSLLRGRRRPTQLRSDVVWFCVPDAAIARVALNFSSLNWADKFALHSSGVLTSDVFACLRNSGASVASAHPLMTFVMKSQPDLAGVSFVIEGDRPALRVANRIVDGLGAVPITIRKQDKAAYHAFATMVCPLLVSLLAASEKAAALAGISAPEARRRMMPIVLQTLRNYERLGAAKAFSGPIVRGDAETIRAHLRALKPAHAAQRVYAALVQAALEILPCRNRGAIRKLFGS